MATKRKRRKRTMDTELARAEVRFFPGYPAHYTTFSEAVDQGFLPALARQQAHVMRQFEKSRKAMRKNVN